MPEHRHAPRIRFLIGGVQKGGTSALARFLGAHPGVRLPRGKEAHVFDAQDYDEAADADAVNARFAPHFDAMPAEALHGDATPITLFLPAVIARVARYNPAMRWIVLLREPAERALSHYRMERGRGWEQLPLWVALLREKSRLLTDNDPLAEASHHRRHSYLARGDYAAQLDALYAHFPQDQVLLLKSTALRTQPETCLQAVCRFLALPPPPAGIDYAPVFVGPQPAPARHSFTLRLLRWLLRRERRALRLRYGIDFDD